MKYLRPLTSAGVKLPKKKEDNKKATEFVVRYIGATNLLSNLIAHDAEDDIETLSWILELGAFHIKLKAGQHDAARDAEFKRDIKSADPITKAHAILYVIYYVRLIWFTVKSIRMIISGCWYLL
jgi:hypothetical protein